MIVRELAEKLKAGEITGDRAKEIAKIVLEMVPEDIVKEKLVKIIPQLEDKISEPVGVVYQILSGKDDQEKSRKLEHLRNMIRSMQNV
jgi:phosphate uptake regulator